MFTSSAPFSNWNRTKFFTKKNGKPQTAYQTESSQHPATDHTKTKPMWYYVQEVLFFTCALKNAPERVEQGLSDR